MTKHVHTLQCIRHIHTQHTGAQEAQEHALSIHPSRNSQLEFHRRRPRTIPPRGVCVFIFVLVLAIISPNSTQSKRRNPPSLFCSTETHKALPTTSHVPARKRISKRLASRMSLSASLPHPLDPWGLGRQGEPKLAIMPILLFSHALSPFR